MGWTADTPSIKSRWTRRRQGLREPSPELIGKVRANRKMLLVKQIDIENEVRGTLRVFGLKLSGRIQQAAFERQAMELVADRPELAAMVRPMLIARAALREQCVVLQDDAEGCSW